MFTGVPYGTGYLALGMRLALNQILRKNVQENEASINSL